MAGTENRREDGEKGRTGERVERERERGIQEQEDLWCSKGVGRASFGVTGQVEGQRRGRGC